MATKHYFGVAATVVLALVPTTLACGSCYGPTSHVEHVRHVKRMQPGALNASYGPTRPLEWGQLNFLHTTDTHGWLEGHLKERNFGADWGDFVSFSTHFKNEADKLDVDLLLVDTGDLHDGTGLSDATSPDGKLSNQIFDDIDYDILTIGNHELYLADVAYQTLNEISAYWGEKYLTSNVQIVNQQTGEWEYIGKTHRYFTTKRGNINVTKIIPAETMVTQEWFIEAINYDEPIDVFVVLGHNPVRNDTGLSTLGPVYNAIRHAHPNTPIQIFGGHTHIRDFVVYDESSVAIESGESMSQGCRYCETLGWLSMSGFTKENSGYHGVIPNPAGVPNPTRKATETSTSPFRYSRRYLDWNRKTFIFHSGTQEDDFDYEDGRNTTSQITKYRHQLNLDDLYGCVPKDYCVSCALANSSDSIYPLLSEALATVIVNETRKTTPRYIIANTGGVRFDMYKGPFTYDDGFIISPYLDTFFYVKDVPYELARSVLPTLNGQHASKTRSLEHTPVERDICVDPIVGPLHSIKRDDEFTNRLVGVTRRQVADLTPGPTTMDDWGTDGDDTEHSEIPYYDEDQLPRYFQGEGGFVPNVTVDVVDVVFVNHTEDTILKALGPKYSRADVDYYVSPDITTQTYLSLFVKQSELFQADFPNCPTN
ncbi:ser/Thr protein phosphatase family [Xylaria intraflava]|nr:ser/Thr protein phosphatase family [Xylaria intraflava]